MQDVNGTGFLLVLGQADWRDQMGVGAAEGHEAVVYDAGRRCATLRPRIDRFPRRAVEPALTPRDRTSVAQDRYGSWYWIDPADPTRIVVRSAGDGSVETFWPSPKPSHEFPEEAPTKAGAFRPVGEEGPSPQALGALTITTDHRLVVAATGPDQLLVFDLHAGGPPARRPLSDPTSERAFRPVDAAARPNSGLYLLDASDDGPARLWVLDRTLRSIGPSPPAKTPPIFQPVDGDEEETPSDRPPGAGPVDLPGDLSPQVVEALPDDTVLVLSVDDGGTSVVRRYQVGGIEGTVEEKGQVDLLALLAPEEANIAAAIDWGDWRAHDVAFVPGAPDPTDAFRGRLVVVGSDGNQAYALDLSGDRDDLTASRRPDTLLLRRFSGKGIVSANREVRRAPETRRGAGASASVYYDVGDRWVPLVPRRRTRYEARGQVQSAPFDSGLPACTWHRIFFDACLPPDTTVQVESRASDRVDRLADQPWQLEPDLYLRAAGAEIPYYDPFAGQDSTRAGQGTWEVLLQRAEGRYLQLRLTLEGDERSAPRLYAMRLYAPRFSYLDQYLPDVYREDEASAGFVERFLAISEGTLTALEGRIAGAQALFDVRTVPDEYVDWLGSWFGAVFDPVLDVRRKRLFLRHAVELYNQRGTRAGLARMLSLALDACVDDRLFTPAGIAAAVGRPAAASEQIARAGGVRIVEQFAARDVPRAVLGDATAPEQPTEVRVDQSWTPADGAEALNRRFQTFLADRYPQPGDREAVWRAREPAFPTLLPPLDAPAASQRRADWRQFVRQVIDGPYAAIDAGEVREATGDAADSVTRRYRAFLQRRYRTVERLQTADPGRPASFDALTLPRSLPTGLALQDWMHFAGAVLPIQRAAHRFTVLVPVDPDAPVAEQRRRLELARRIVDREKPAHTDVDVLPYDAAFQIGTARTGLDTVLGTGRRFGPLLVGDDRLSEAIVGAAHPAGVPNRRLVGRDPADASPPL